MHTCLNNKEMTSQNQLDLEDLLDNFIIRKPRDQTQSQLAALSENKKDGPKIHKHIPLLVTDLLGSSLSSYDKNVFTVCNRITLDFRTCLVYGYVVGQGLHNKSFYKYIIDDGTGTIEVSIRVKPKDFNSILSLHNEVKALLATPGSEQYEQASIGMTQLLAKALEYIDGSVILPGSNILLFGRPNYFRNKAELEVISFSVDTVKSRNFEIAFAENLLQFYHRHQAK